MHRFHVSRCLEDYLGMVTVSAVDEIENESFASEISYYIGEDSVDVAWVTIPATECGNDHR